MDAPVVDVPNRSTKAVRGGLEFDNPVPISGACPIMGEAQKVKRPRTIVCWLIPIRPRGRRKEPHQLRLGGVDGQTILAKSFRDDFHDTSGIALVAEPNHESSSPGESHPQALTEPDVNLSAHPALIVQSQDESHAPTT